MSFINTHPYIALKHRNALETWSSGAVLLSQLTTYDFTTSASKALRSNMKDMGNSKFALYSGDVNQDGVINQADLDLEENYLNVFGTGYLPYDLTGDGVIESASFSLLENNIGKVFLMP